MRVLLSAAGSTMSVKPDNPALKKLHERKDFDRVMMVLEGLGLISFVRPDGITFMWYSITREGRCYFERRAEERYRAIINSVVLPVLVAIITTTVTVYILPTLGQSAKRWLENSRKHLMQSPPAIETTSVQSQNPQSFPEYPE